MKTLTNQEALQLMRLSEKLCRLAGKIEKRRGRVATGEYGEDIILDGIFAAWNKIDKTLDLYRQKQPVK